MQLAHNQASRLIQIDQAKESETYYCPSCGARCVIKRGMSNRPHFAHRQGQSCQSGESEHHLTMKKTLHAWISQTDEVHSEFYFKAIKKRADLYVPGNNHVLEYQLSHTTHEELIKRTLAYHSIGLRVTWLIGELQDNNKTVVISRFIGGLISYHQQLGFYLIAYSPTTQQFISYDSLQQQHGQFFYARQRRVKVAEITYRQLSRWLFRPKEQVHHPRRQYSELKRQIQINRFNSKSNRSFRSYLYHRKEHLQYFPYFVGVELPQQWFIQTPAFVWQYHLIQCFNQRKSYSESELHRWWYEVIKPKSFVTMTPDSYQLVIIYLRVLRQLNKLTYQSGQYQIVAPIGFNRIEQTREWSLLTQVVQKESTR